MTEPFQNEVTVVTGTQKIVVDSVGKVTVVKAGPVGPPGVGGGGGVTSLSALTDVDLTTDVPADDDVLAWDSTSGKWTPAALAGSGEAGVTSLSALTDVDLTTDPPADDDLLAWDATASKWTPASLAGALDHTHPEYAQFTYAVGFGGDITDFGGSYNVDGSITMGMMAGFNLPPGTTIKVFFRGSPNSAFDAGYIYTTEANPVNDTWVLQPYDTPFTLGNIGKVISINFDLSVGGQVLGSVYSPTLGTYDIRTVSWNDHTHPGLGVTLDARPSAQEYLRADWEAWSAPLMTTNPTPAVTAGDYNATWTITDGTTRGTLPQMDLGLDVQWFGRVKRPWTDEEVLAGGQVWSVWPFQTFYELLTLTRPSIRNDWWEWARHMKSVSQGVGMATYFLESTLPGSPNEEDHTVSEDTGIDVGAPERARITHDTQTSTVTLWNWMPYNNGDPTLEQCPRGLWWKPVFTDTNVVWAAIANPETQFVPANPEPGFTEGDPEVIVPWRIGIQGSLEIAEFFIYEFGGTVPKLQIDAGTLTAAGVNATSFTDGTGDFTLSTISAYTIPGPASTWAEVNHNHAGVYDPVGSAAAAQAAAVAYSDLLAPGYASFDHGHVASEVANLGTAALVDIIDEDDMVTNSQFRPPSQQSVKAYVDANAGGAASVYPTLPIYPSAGLDGTGVDAYGCLPWDSAGNFADVAIAKGQFIGGWCNRYGTINTISFNVMASNLTTGQAINVLCYAIDPTTGRVTGTPLWDESIVVGTVLGAYIVPTSVPRVLPQNGSCLFVLNSNNNAHSVTLKQYQPTGPYNFATATLNARPALSSAMTLYTAGPDLSAWKIGSVAGANVFAATQRMPVLELR